MQSALLLEKWYPSHWELKRGTRQIADVPEVLLREREVLPVADQGLAGNCSLLCPCLLLS